MSAPVSWTNAFTAFRLDRVSSPRTFAPLAILIIVFFLNFQHIFLDLLWHDDGLWYYLATEGSAIQDSPGRAKVSSLVPYLDYFYAYGMLEWGVPFVRSCFVLVMFLCSFFLYHIYRKILGLNEYIALIAAIIPNILPSLIGIPAGLNASYAMWGLLPLLISILFVFHSLVHRGPKSYFYFLMGFFTYATGLNITDSSNFMIPVVLFVFVIFFIAGHNKLKLLGFGIPFLFMGIWQIYKQLLSTHKTPTGIPVDEVLNRSVQFVEMGSFLLFNSTFSIYITSLLLLLGLIGLVSKRSSVLSRPAHFHCSDATYKGLLFLWPLIWIISNSVAYVAMSPTFRVNDYAYVSNYGVVLLQVCGGGYLWYLLAQRFERLRNLGVRSWLLAFVLLFTFIGIQKSTYFSAILAEWYGQPTSSPLIRDSLEMMELPDDTQILILNTPTAQQGVYKVNTGYMRYLLNRNDVTGLVGAEFFPNDVFEKSTKWLDRMRNFELHRPTIAFKRSGDELIRQNLLLQVKSTKSKELPRLKWSLYDIGDPVSPPIKIKEGLGMDAYYKYVENLLPQPFSVGDIAFAPPDIPTAFVSQEIAEKISSEPNLISSPVKFDNIVTLLSLRILKPESEHRLQALLRVEKKPKIFSLGYRVNNTGSGQTIPLWEMALKGDHILMEIPIHPNQDHSKKIFLELLDMSKWPPIALNVTRNRAVNRVEIHLDSEI